MAGLEKKHLLAGLIALTALLMVFIVGCRIVSVPDAQQTPIIVTVLGFLVQIGLGIWGKADSDAKIRQVETKVEVAADKADTAAQKAEAVASSLAPPAGRPP